MNGRSFKMADIGKGYLIFMLDQEEFAIDILKIQEILSCSDIKIRAMPDSPFYMKGFASWHGGLIPIIDLKMLYQGVETQHDDFTVIIIVNVNGEFLGMMVSAVSEMITLTEDQLKSASICETRLSHCSIENIGVIDKRILIILDPEKLLMLHKNAKGKDNENG